MTKSNAQREIEHRYFTCLSPSDTESLLSCGLELIKEENITQHYIAKSHGNTVRLRRSESAGEISYVICVKGQGDGVNEVEDPVSPVFALPIMDGAFNTPSISKKRYTFLLGYAGLKIEVDFFEGALFGLVIAEIEVPHDKFSIPEHVLPGFIKRIMSDAERFALSNYGLAMMSDDERQHIAMIYSVNIR